MECLSKSQKSAELEDLEILSETYKQVNLTIEQARFANPNFFEACSELSNREQKLESK